jgi:hypothetical protein
VQSAPESGSRGEDEIERLGPSSMLVLNLIIGSKVRKKRPSRDRRGGGRRRHFNEAQDLGFSFIYAHLRLLYLIRYEIYQRTNPLEDCDEGAAAKERGEAIFCPLVKRKKFGAK